MAAEEIGLLGDLWSIQAALGELFLREDDEKQARRTFTRAATILHQLADSLGDDEQKKSFLASPLILHVLEQSDSKGQV